MFEKERILKAAIKAFKIVDKENQTMSMSIKIIMNNNKA